MTTITTDTEIVKDVRSSYSKAEKRSIHAAYLNGEYIGTFDSREQAEAALDDEMYRLLEDGLIGAALDDEPAPADCCQTVIANVDGIHLNQYTIVLSAPGETFCYDRKVLCDGCAAQVSNRHTEGEVINGYCDACGAGPSVSHYRPAPADCCQAALFDLDTDPIAQELRHMRRKLITPFTTTSRYSFLATYDGIPVASVTTNHAGDVVLDDYALDCGYIARSLVVEHAPESLVLACTLAPQPRGVPLTGNEVALIA